MLIHKRHSLFFRWVISIVTGITFWLLFRHCSPIQQLVETIGLATLITSSLQLIVHYSLAVFNIDSVIDSYKLLIPGSRGMAIVYGCLSISHFALFAGLIIGFSGKAKTMLWYIPLGILILHVVNALRLIIIGIVLKYAPSYDELSHYFVTRIFMYSAILGLWITWIYINSRNRFNQDEDISCID